jgi:1,4-dihydroxy-2-naphthoyl-CoA synthase
LKKGIIMSSQASSLQLENVLYEKKGSIAYVTFNRPKVLNALNKALIAELKAAFEDCCDDSAVRGVILTGAGDKAFAAGADISELVNDTALEAEEKSRNGQAVTRLIENLGKPVIAAVNGFALGGGCELAMACTIRLAAETAKFGQPEVKIGTMPGYGGFPAPATAGRQGPRTAPVSSVPARSSVFPRWSSGLPLQLASAIISFAKRRSALMCWRLATIRAPRAPQVSRSTISGSR